MAKILIANLDINTDDLLKSSVEIKKQIDDIKKSQKELTKSGETASRQFVENSADLKVLGKAYNTTVKAISENTQATINQTNRTQALAGVLDREVTSIKEARDQNKLLNKLRNEANATTAEGKEEIKRLNNALDANNEFIEENADAYTQQKINIGNYKDSVSEALGELNLFNGGLGGFISRSQEVGGVGSLLSSSLGAATKGIIGMTQASLAFIATPIGAVIALLAGAFLLVQNALNRSEEATNKLSLAFSKVTGVLQGILKALEPIGEFLIDGIVVGFELATQAAEAYVDAIAAGLAFLGFDEASESLLSFKDELIESAQAAQDLEQAEQDLTKAQRESRKVQLEFQRDAEKLRQIRDDETKSFQERIKANEELGKVLQQQLSEELAIAQKALDVANLRLQVEGETTESLDARAEALTEIADIQERITGQESEQLTNRVQLQREAADKAIEAQKAELDFFVESQGIKAKTLEQEAIIAQQVADKKLDILKAELANRKITQAGFDAEQSAIQNELLQAQTDAVVNNADRELQEFIRLNQSKLEQSEFFTEAQLLQEQRRIDLIEDKEKQAAAFRLEQGSINEEEYQDAILQIEEDAREKNLEARQNRDALEKERQAIDLQNRRETEDLIFQENFEIQAERLELQRLQEVENAELTGASIDLINEKFAAKQNELNQAQKVARLSNEQATIGEIGNLLSAFGKKSQGIQVAFATADAILAVQKAYTSQLVPGDPTSLARAIGAAVKTGLFGAANVAKVAGVKFERGGLQEIGGRRHSQGGTKFMGEDGTAFEAEQGELIGVMNRNAAQHFMAFNDSFPAGNSTPSFFQGGGIISQGVSAQSLDTNELAEITAEAVASIPPPIVTVEDINAGQDGVAEVVSGADL